MQSDVERARALLPLCDVAAHRWSDEEVRRVRDLIKTIAQEPVSVSGGVPADVRTLVVAAREVAYGDPDPTTLVELDKAAEAFGSRVPWDDELSALEAAPASDGVAIPDGMKPWHGRAWGPPKDHAYGPVMRRDGQIVPSPITGNQWLHVASHADADIIAYTPRPSEPQPIGGEREAPYKAVDRDFAHESREGSVSPLRVIREMATNAGIHGAPIMKGIFEEVCADANRESFARSRLKGALLNLLFSLHARPHHGHTLMSVEDAIAAAEAALDAQKPGAQA